jgi:hypothetical protein
MAKKISLCGQDIKVGFLFCFEKGTGYLNTKITSGKQIYYNDEDNAPVKKLPCWAPVATPNHHRKSFRFSHFWRGYYD